MSMQRHSLKFFGTSAAVPSKERGFSCIGVISDETNQSGAPSEFGSNGSTSCILLDCGDGSVRRIIQSGESVFSIRGILITHLHSDHVSGLAQIIETMAIEKREQDLMIYGPKGLEDYFAAVERSTRVAFNRNFKIQIKELAGREHFSISSTWNVKTLAMNHTIPCLGYRLETAKEGGEILTLAYTGDTVPCGEVEELARAVRVLIHEATFLRKDLPRALETKHSVPSQAAEIARKAMASRLILTHVNDKYESPGEMIEEAKPLFENVQVAFDGLRIDLG
jgi:ribonuclease Z